MLLVHSAFAIKYLKVSLGCIHSIVAQLYGVTKSACTCTCLLFTALIQHVSAKSQTHLANNSFMLFKHFEHLFAVEVDSNPRLWILCETTSKSALPLQTHSTQGVKVYNLFIASNLTHIALHLYVRPWILSHRIAEIRIRSSVSGNMPRNTQAQKKPFGISMKNRPSKKHPVYRWALKLVEKAWRLQQWWLMKRHTHIHLCHQSCC